jgi:hypothetical protein
MIVNVSEAKANLSKLIEMAYHDEEVIIAKMICRLWNWYRIGLRKSVNLDCRQGKLKFLMILRMKIQTAPDVRWSQIPGIWL